MDARITEVVERALGSALIANAAIGATTLTVADTSDFDEAGVLTVGAETLAYTAIDPDTGNITLAGPTTAAHSTDDLVTLSPLSIERRAVLAMSDDEDDEAGLVARIPHALYDKIPVGIRDPAAGESVQADFYSAELVITELTGQVPVVDGTYLDPATIPAGPPPALTDGNPPASSPVATLTPGIGTIYAFWPAITNHDPVTYDVYLSPTPGFTPASGSFVASTSATAMTLRTDPTNANALLDYATSYYVRIVARDADGSAPAGGQAGPMSPAQVTGPDIAAATITGDRIVGNTITADLLASVLVLASTIETAESGQRVVIDTAGVRLIAADGSTLVNLPTDPNQSPTFSGNVITGGLTVTGGAHIQGATNYMEQGSALTLQSQVAAPTQIPGLAFEYETQILDAGAPGAGVYGNLDCDPNGRLISGGSGVTYLATCVNSVSNWLCEWEAATGNLVRSIKIPTGSNVYIMGCARVGAYIYIAWYNTAQDQIRVRCFDQSTLAQVGGDWNETTTGGGHTTIRYSAVMGTDGTNLLFASWASPATGANARITRYTPSGATITFLDAFTTSGGTITLDAANQRVLSGVTGRDGSNHAIEFSRPAVGGRRVAVYNLFNATTHALQTTDGASWVAGCVKTSGNQIDQIDGGGIAWNPTGDGGTMGAGWRGMSDTVIANYSGMVWPADGQNWFYVGETWTQAAGGYHTRISPLAAIRLDGANPSIGLTSTGDAAMRGQLRVTGPGLPATADGIALYALRSATAPVTTTMRQQSAPYFSTTTGGFTVYWRSYNAAGAVYVDSNTFPGGVSTIQSDPAANIPLAPWKLSGDGTLVLPVVSDPLLWPNPSKGDIAISDEVNGPVVWTGVAWVPVGYARVSAARYFEEAEEFWGALGNNPNWGGAGTAGGSVTGNNPTADVNHPGIVQLNTGSTVNATGAADLSMVNGVILGNGPVYGMFIVKTPGNNTLHLWRIGLVIAQFGGSAAQGYFFTANPDTFTGIQLIARDTTPANTTNSTYWTAAVVPNTWYLLEILTSNDGRSARFQVNRSGWSPSVAMANPGTPTVLPAVGITKNTSTGTGRVMTVDHINFSARMLTNRYT